MIKTILRAAQGQRGTGCIPGPVPPGTPHLNDLIGLSSAALPQRASVRQALVRPKNQSSTNSCLGQSAAQAYRLASLSKGIPCPELSGLFPYKLGRAAIGIEDTDGGMTLGATLTAVKRFGIATEADWPFSVIKVNARPTAKALQGAFDRRGLRGYYVIGSSDTDGVRRALAAGLPVIGCFPIDAYFGINTGSSLIDRPLGQTGYHAMVIEDYGPDGTFGILNHYGEDWRDGGRCRFTERYLQASVGLAVFDITL